VTDAQSSGVSYQPVEHHPPVEEYLQAIESLNEEGTPAIQARIAERLGRSAPTVSEMLDRLASDGYVERSGRTITLTEQGQDVAQTVLRKHRLAERLLVDVIGLPWHLVHDEAGRWEHVMSDEVMARLTQILGDPATCPHGNPIPGSANHPGESASQVSLADIEPGQKVRFERLGEEVELDGTTLLYLDEAGFIPGATATVTNKGPDGTLLLDADGTTLVLGADLCQRLYVVVL
jgi:DtxR family Mn-dependent transcriptional regulator